jgi:hypothetical protein
MNSRFAPRPARKGSSIVLALALGIVLLILIGGLRQFSSHRIQSSIREWNSLKAISMAEAGISMLFTQLSQNLSFATHQVTNDLKWGSGISFTVVSLNGPISVANSSGNLTGSISGSPGDFQVRCGLIPYPDDPDTKNIDESKGYLLVESIGTVFNTSRIIRAVINRRFPAKECLLYDGDVLSVVYGDDSSSGEYNNFASGNFYGHNGVEISQVKIPGAGTNQRFNDVDKIISGKGGIVFESEVKITPRSTNAMVTMAPSSGWESASWDSMTYDSQIVPGKNQGQYPKEFLDAAPQIQKEHSSFLRDKHNPTVMTPSFLPISYFRSLSGGCPGANAQIQNLGGTEVSMKLINFGTKLNPKNADPPGNGIIYSDDDIAIMGNPSRSVTIVSAKNVYVVGDFNQAESSSPEHKFGFPQNYRVHAKNFGDQDFDYNSPKVTDANYQLARVYAGERVIFNYYDLKRCFANEIYPFLRYRLAAEIADDPSGDPAFASFLKVGGNEQVEKFHEENVNMPPDQTTDPDTGVETPSDAEYEEQVEAAQAEALEQAKEKILEKIKTFLTTNCGVDWANYETDMKNKVQEESSGSESKVKVSLKLDNTTALKMDDFTKKVWEEMAADKLAVVFEELRTKYTEVANSGGDKTDDYLFYPELTTTGMFVSFAKRNTSFKPGPEFNKHFDEVGNTVPMLSFVHRMYGSESWFRVNDVDHVSTTYNPPIRKKIYDKSLPTKWDDSGTGKMLDIPTYSILTWKEFSSSAGFQ